MSFIVKGLRKPKSCTEYKNGKIRRCVFLDENEDCKAQRFKNADTWEEQFANCPIVSLPYDHGMIADVATGKVYLQAEHDSFSRKKGWEL